MPSLPTQGGNNGTWGDDLNTWLLADHNSDGTNKTVAPYPFYLPFVHGPTATGAFSNLAASTVGAVGDPLYRTMVDLVGYTHVKMVGRITGSLAAATKIRIQYHTGGNLGVASADGGWTTLITSAGGHTLNVMFTTGELSVPSGAQITDCILRMVLFDGDGAADPSVSNCALFFYV